MANKTTDLETILIYGTDFPKTARNGNVNVNGSLPEVYNDLNGTDIKTVGNGNVNVNGSLPDGNNDLNVSEMKDVDKMGELNVTGVTDEQMDEFSEKRNEPVVEIADNQIEDGERDDLAGMRDEIKDELYEIENEQMEELNEREELGDEDEKEWMMNEMGSMNLLDESKYVLQEEVVSTAPIDRGWAWMAVVGCFGMHILAVGGIKSFGVLFVELEHRYDTNSKTLASIQAIPATVMMGLSPISNALSQRFGCRRVVFIGGLFLMVGFFSSAFVPSYEWLYLTYSVIAGVGFGLSYAPCIVFIGHHFSKYRALANGLSVSGSGVGTFIFPPFIHFFVEWYGLSGALMLMSAVLFHICACAMIFRPLSDYKKKIVKKWVLKSELKRENYNDLEIGEDCEKMVPVSIDNGNKNCVQNGRKAHRKFDLIKQESDAITGSFVDITAMSLQTLPQDENKLKNGSIFCCVKSSTPKSSYTECRKFLSLLTNPVFQIFLISNMLATFAYPQIFLMVPSYAEEIKVDQQSGAMMVSVIGISDLVGRVFFGWFSDLRLLPRKFEFMGTMCISGVLSFILPFIKTKVALFVYCGLYGFFAGSYVCLIAVVLVDILGLKNLSMGFGIVGLSMAIGLLCGPPVVGALRDAFGSWDNSFIFVGLIAIIGSLFILLEPLAQRKVQRDKKLKEENKLV